MVTMIPGYMYSIFAALIVGTILISACSVAMLNLRTESASQQLENTAEYVATQSLTLVNQVTENGQNITDYLNLPTQIGNQAYWISLGNDSSGAWIESGFGTSAFRSLLQLNIPADFAASGTFIDGWGRPFLQCYVLNETVYLTLFE